MAQRLTGDSVAGMPFDYTFTETELADILGFMENQQQQTEVVAPAPVAPFAGSGNTMPLQFQPHTSDSLGQPTPSHSGDSRSDDGVTVKRELSTGLSNPLPDTGASLTGLNGYYTKSSGAHATSRSPLAASTDALPLETRTHSGTGIAPFGAGLGGSNKKGGDIKRNLAVSRSTDHKRHGNLSGIGPCVSKLPVLFAEGHKGHVSHSTVEKQRRDRINALIDEVRAYFGLPRAPS